MAFFAGSHDIPAIHRRQRVVGIIDVVGAVAVGAPGRLLVTKLVCLAVIGIHVGFSQVFMAFAALDRHLVHKLILLDVGNFMCSMTISACWVLMFLVVMRDGMIALDVFVENAFMAGCTGSRNILRVYGDLSSISFNT
jgi:hypothetical protein